MNALVPVPNSRPRTPLEDLFPLPMVKSGRVIGVRSSAYIRNKTLRKIVTISLQSIDMLGRQTIEEFTATDDDMKTVMISYRAEIPLHFSVCGPGDTFLRPTAIPGTYRLCSAPKTTAAVENIRF